MANFRTENAASGHIFLKEPKGVRPVQNNILPLNFGKHPADVKTVHIVLKFFPCISILTDSLSPGVNMSAGHSGVAFGKDDFWKIGYAEGIRKLITIEIEADPNTVGPPIDILRIGESGAEWIQRKPECR